MSQILQTREPQSKLIKSSRYRKRVLEFVDIIRKHGYKYKQIRYDFGDIRHQNRVCALGLYNTFKFGGPFNTPMDIGKYYDEPFRSVVDLNDSGRSFNEIADELERGVSVIS